MTSPQALRFAILLLLPVVGCADGARDEARDGASIAIGFAFGADSTVLSEEYRGMALAIEALNAGRQRGPAFEIRFVAPVSSGDGLQVVLSVAAQLRDDPSVVGAVGFSETISTLGVSNVTADRGADERRALPLITPTATGTALSGISPWVFRLAPIDTAFTRAAVEYLADSLGARRVAIVYPTTTNGKFWLRDLSERLGRRDIPVAMALAHRRSDLYDTLSSLWPAVAADIKRSRAEAVVIPVASQWRDLAEALHEAGVAIPVITGDGAGSYPQHTRLERPVLVPTRVIPPSAEARAFEEAYRQRYGASSTTTAMATYDAAMLIGTASREAGANRRDVRDWLRGLGSARPAWQGVTGPIAFDSSNDMVAVRVALERMRP